MSRITSELSPEKIEKCLKEDVKRDWLFSEKCAKQIYKILKDTKYLHVQSMGLTSADLKFNTDAKIKLESFGFKTNRYWRYSYYPNDFCVRYWRHTGNETEWSKIWRLGLPAFYFNGWLDEKEENIIAYKIINMDNFRNIFRNRKAIFEKDARFAKTKTEKFIPINCNYLKNYKNIIVNEEYLGDNMIKTF